MHGTTTIGAGTPERWLIEADGEIRSAPVGRPGPSLDGAVVAHGRVDPGRGFGSVRLVPEFGDRLALVLDMLDARYPGTRWFVLPGSRPDVFTN